MSCDCGPPRFGFPRTDEERLQRHRELTGETTLPDRQYGNRWFPGTTGLGFPRTDEERLQIHRDLTGETILPERQYGNRPVIMELNKFNEQTMLSDMIYTAESQQLPVHSLTWDSGTFLCGILAGFVFGGFVLTTTGRTILFGTGQRAAKRIEGGKK